MDKPEKIETFDAVHGIGILSGMRPNEQKLGPARRAPEYYAGETYGALRDHVTTPKGRHARRAARRAPLSPQAAESIRRTVHYHDVERYPNGALPSKRNKLMRRVLRNALKVKLSKIDSGLKLPRAMIAQAREVARDDHKGESRSANGRWANRLYVRELAIHQARPGEPTRKMRRAYAKLLKKHGQKDAIAQLVDRMAKP